MPDVNCLSPSQTGQFPLPGAASLWEATAGLPAPARALKGSDRADVAIVGAGYTGLSAAHHLAAKGLRPIVLEANRVGWGASGRNGGFVSSKFRPSFRTIAETHGLPTARRMHRLGHEAVDLVERLVEEFGIKNARYARVGNLRCAHNDRALAQITSEAEWLRAELGDGSISLLSRAQVAEQSGSTVFVGGVLNSLAGAIHPLNYARGIAAGLAQRGVDVFELSPAIHIRREPSGLVIETERGRLRADQLVIATNAYSDLSPATDCVKRTLIPFRSAILATEPLPTGIAERLMSAGRCYSETRRMMRWFRKVENRVVFGGRGAFGKNDSPAAFESLRRAMTSIFPELAGVSVTHQWSGLVAMTLDHLPHVGRLDDRVSYAMGYNGAGVAMATLMGRYVADFVRGEAPDMALLDAKHQKPVPFYSLREPAVRLTAGWYQFLDAIGR